MNDCLKGLHVYRHKSDGWFYCVHCLRHVFVHISRNSKTDMWTFAIEEVERI